MKPTTRLESVIFQLTPTRTRYDLFIVANGIKEKLNSGLLNRFLAHLKTAEDQISKGSYSIILKPKDDDDAGWFTKGTVERFVRFVSTPEILERVYTIESEILQIGKAILIQGNNESRINAVEDHQAKPMPRTEACNGRNFTLDADEKKAMVLYMPGPQPPETNGSDAQEGNSKVQLLKVLETRINVLRKEQGMAFARASAAGFDIGHMAPLVSFAKCFGASRLMDACLKFLDLWKRKHETGQLLETETEEAMPKLKFSTADASGTIHSNENAAVDESADIRPPVNQLNPVIQHEYLSGQYPHPMLPPWPMHSPPGVLPFYQGPPMQTPYHQNYSPNGSYYQSPYETWENSQLNVGQRRHSMEGITEPDLLEGNILRMESAYNLEDSGTSHLRLQKKAEKSGKKHLGTVVNGKISNITSGVDLNTELFSEVHKGDVDLFNNTPNMMDQGHLRSFKRKEREGKPAGEMTLYDKEEASTADGENWQAFQNCLLRETEENSCLSDIMFARERNIQIRPHHTGCHDPLASVKRDAVELQAGRLAESYKDDGNVSNFPRLSNDEFSVYREGTHHSGRLETGIIHMTGFKGRSVLYKNKIYEASFGGEKESQSNLGSSSELAINGYEIATDNLAYMVDESFTLPLRSMSVDQVNSDGRAVIDINFQLPSTQQSSENVLKKTGIQVRYEPNELSLLPERWSEKRQIGYDHALDYEKQLLLNIAASKHTEFATDAKQGSKIIEGKKARAVLETLDKKRSRGPLLKGKLSKTNPLEEARIRAERLRSYKADLQKLRKEKEEAEQKRIESLKTERKKRIAARGSLTSGTSLLPSASRKSLPAKLSPVSHKGSKFSDSEPGSSSPLQRSKIRTALFGATDSKVSMVPKSVDTRHKTINRLTRSVSVTKTESNVSTPDLKASMARIRRLSEPKTISSHSASSAKISSARSGSKVKASSNEFEGKKASATTNCFQGNVLSLPEFKLEPFEGPVKVNQKSSAEKLFEGKKASALANADNRKVVSLPGSEFELSKGPVKLKQNKSAEKEMTRNINREKSFVTSANDKLGLVRRKPHHDLDDDPVIEKTVVMLECQKPSAPVVPASEEKLSVLEKQNHDNIIGETTLAVPEYKSIYATTSPLDRVQKETTIQTLEAPISDEVMTNNMEKKSADLPVTSALIKSDDVPSAQVSSLEYRNSKYGKLQLTSLGSTSVKTGELQDSSFKHMKLENVPKALESKGQTKSVKRFLKLGRRNRSSTSSAGEQIAESHSTTTANGSEPRETETNTDSTSKVHTLRNLLSQEETRKPTVAQTSHKYSHHFSLLSPFLSKTSEKKLIT
ncbi:uncharacterized protein LOC141677514 isoform X2 [Apium graveolens]|uniref:uncharacterized protein LOC141677514 isoform X2 n=1 Tax=Apium graveolens TaxID=4045 RepID=UPI003D7A88EB